MKVVSKNGGMVSLPLLADEIQPLGGFHLPDVIQAVCQRYGVAVPPPAEKLRIEGARFRQAHLRSGYRTIPIIELGLFSDGISATTADTDDAEIVVNDFFDWLKAQFHFRDPITAKEFTYQSDLVVKFQNDPAMALQPSARKFIERMSAQSRPGTPPLQFASMVFGTDPTTSGPKGTFSVERRVGAPWSSDLYFSKAYLRTSDHIAALESFDECLSKG